jgi:hypothetical protein
MLAKRWQVDCPDSAQPSFYLHCLVERSSARDQRRVPWQAKSVVSALFVFLAMAGGTEGLFCEVKGGGCLWS